MIRLPALLAAISTTVCAVNTIEREFACPIDGRKFKQRIETSAQPAGVRLDLKRLGDVVDPPTLPQCPDCHFVVFMDRWTDPMVKRLKPFVLGPDFQLLASKNPSYFCLAQIQDFLRAPAIYTGHSYLRASWQVEEKDGPRERCLSLALERFEAALSAMKPGDGEYTNTVLLCGEIERRLKRWDAAAARFRKLAVEVPAAERSQRAIIERQVALIGKQDSAPHAADERGSKLPEPPAPSVKPDRAEETPAPASLKEASAAADQPLVAGKLKAGESEDDLPPIAEGPGRAAGSRSATGLLSRGAPEPAMLPEPRPLKSVAGTKPLGQSAAPRRQKVTAKPAIVAVPEGRKKVAKLIGAPAGKSR